jgi:hypothetical protein
MCIHILKDMLLARGGVVSYENDLSAKNQAESKSSWLSRQNENCRRQKGFSCQKSKGKSKVNSLRKLTHQAARNCGLLFSKEWL